MNTYDDPFDQLLADTNFPNDFKNLELDSLLFDIDNSQGTSGTSLSSSSLNQDSSSADSSPKLSSTQFPNPFGEEMWDYNPPLDRDNPDYNFTPYRSEESPNWLYDAGLETELEHDFTVHNNNNTFYEPPPSQPQFVAPVPVQNVKNNKVKIVPQRQYKQLQVRCEPKSQCVALSQPQKLVPIVPAKPVPPEQQSMSPAEIRKAQNRVYAQKSRDRKKKEETEVMKRIGELERENAFLKSENRALKQRLAKYEKINLPLTPPGLSPNGNDSSSSRLPAKRKFYAAGATLAVFGLFALVSPITFSSFGTSMDPQKASFAHYDKPYGYHGRVIDDDPAIDAIENESLHSPNISECGKYKLNASEVSRVNNEIDQWVKVHTFNGKPMKFAGGLMNKDAMQKFNKNHKLAKIEEVLQKKPKTEPRKSEQAAIRLRERTWRQLELLKVDATQEEKIQKIQKMKKPIDKLATIIRQKSDTLYIMALQDYVLLPSLKKGPNHIPKLSLILPSVPINGTLLDQYSLLRVDCEVTGTGQLLLSNKELSYLMP